jgi:hypothetical protein
MVPSHDPPISISHIVSIIALRLINGLPLLDCQKVTVTTFYNACMATSSVLASFIHCAGTDTPSPSKIGLGSENEDTGTKSFICRGSPLSYDRPGLSDPFGAVSAYL